jgi:hypothetical protein
MLEIKTVTNGPIAKQESAAVATACGYKPSEKLLSRPA